jgi:hypothetical protein
MNVLVATNQTQGWRDNDFCCTVEGVNEWLRDVTAELMYLAGGFEAGTVLERRGDIIGERLPVRREAG